MHGQTEDLDEVLDRLSFHHFLLLREDVEQKGESLFLGRVLCDVQNNLGKVDEGQTDHLRHRLKDVLAQLTIFHVFEHAAEDLVDFLCWPVLDFVVVEILNIRNFNLG